MKKVLVTGGTHGIGAEIVEQLEKEGHYVVSCARGNYKTDKKFIECDLSKAADIEMLLKQLDSVDILICNAGGGGRWGNIDWLKTKHDVWEDVYNKNVAYTIRLIEHYLPKMIKNNWGRIITIASILGKESSTDGRPWFQAAKSAQISLIKAFSKNKDYVQKGVTFNTVSPGAIMIEGTGWHTLLLEDKKKYDEFVQSLPMGKMGSPKDVANVVTFLCSEKADYINGANIVVDGGQSFSF